VEEVVIVSGARTAIGRFQGGFANTPASDLAAAVIKAAVERAGIEPSTVDQVVLGCVGQVMEDAYIARHAAVKAGLPVEVPAYTVNRICGSGLEAINTAARWIETGDAEVVVAGGAENMSMLPYYLRNARNGYRLGDGKLEDGITLVLQDPFNRYHMGVTAENLAESYNITKDEQDAFAYKSQMKCKAAQDEGKFKDEIVPIMIPQRRGDPLAFERDEHPKGDTTLETLKGLRAVFKVGGTVSAGNASGINDGAAAVLVTSEKKAKDLGLKPVASIIAYAVGGVDPSIMGIGPVPAIQKALDKAKLSLDDIDLFELNEAFAAQSLAVLRDLPIPEEKINVNGGAIALGHPIGASGTRILVTLLHELGKRKKAKRGLAALCIGGGMGIAIIVEKEKS